MKNYDRKVGPLEREAVRAVQKRMGIVPVRPVLSQHNDGTALYNPNSSWAELPKRKRRMRNPFRNEPIRRVDLTLYDHLPPEDAVRAAWKIAGRMPTYHMAMRMEVGDRMPLLARALYRLERESSD